MSLGLEARLKMFALNLGAEAFSLPTIDLIMGVRASFVIYPFKIGPVEPFVAANTGSVSGEDTKGSETNGFGAGVACRVSKKVQFFAQVRRLHFSFPLTAITRFEVNRGKGSRKESALKGAIIGFLLLRHRRSSC